MEAALQEGPQFTRITRAQDLVLEDMDIAWSSPLSPQEKLSITSTEAWTKYLVASLKSCRGELERQTHKQIRENRRALDRRAKKAFDDEQKGPSKFAGKRAEHRTQEALRWRVPNGLQWVEWHDKALDETWGERLALLQQECPGIRVHHTVGDACVDVPEHKFASSLSADTGDCLPPCQVFSNRLPSKGARMCVSGRGQGNSGECRRYPLATVWNSCCRALP
jgi:hypothetical protein